MEFFDREVQNKNHVIVNFDDGTSKSATIVRDDNPTNEGTPITSAIFRELNKLIEECKTEVETNKQVLTETVENLNNITIESLSVDSTNLPKAIYDKDNNKIVFTLPMPKQGKSYRNMGIWTSTQEYVNNDMYIDTVSLNGCSYYCKKSVYNHQPADNADNEYWGLMSARGNNASVNIVDDLLSDNASYVLSANQGRVLKNFLDEHSAMLSSINSSIGTINTNIQNIQVNIQNLTTRIQNLETKVANMLNGTQSFTKINTQDISTQNMTASGQVNLAGTTNVTGSLVI